MHEDSILSEDYIKRLIESDDPIEETWKLLIRLWRVDEHEYFKQEDVVSYFEWQLNRIFFEIYDYLKEQCERKPLNFTVPLIIMDGMSIREANLLVKDLEEEGYEVVEYGYTFSALPSTTEKFREKLRMEYIQVMSGKIPSELDFEKPVWVSYPDEILHHAARILPPARAYEETKRVLFKILKLAKGNEVTIISDHGYIMTNFLWPLPKEEVRFLKEKVFGSNRYVELERVDPQTIERLKKLPKDLQYIVMCGDYCCVRGRYFWPVSGYGKPIVHGGLSLMECIVPKIRVRP